MSDDETGAFEREAELALYREYRDIAGQFRYAIETERRFYLANDYTLNQTAHNGGLLLELHLRDAWVWDVYRPDRFVKNARVLTHKDVNIEELNAQELNLPEELAF